MRLGRGINAIRTTIPMGLSHIRDTDCSGDRSGWCAGTSTASTSGETVKVRLLKDVPLLRDDTAFDGWSVGPKTWLSSKTSPSTLMNDFGLQILGSDFGDAKPQSSATNPAQVR
jgi:hypothetical protein